MGKSRLLWRIRKIISKKALRNRSGVYKNDLSFHREERKQRGDPRLQRVA